ncbi:MAG: universal stress protein [Bacillota bacterium]
MSIVEKILLAVDGSDSCNKAVVKTNELAEKLNVEVTVLSVVERYMAPEIYSKSDAEKEIAEEKAIEKKGEEIVDSCINIFNNNKINIKRLVKKGRPAEVICKVAEEGSYDLIIISDLGRNAVKKFLLGSTTEKVVRHAKTSVLVVK